MRTGLSSVKEGFEWHPNAHFALGRSSMRGAPGLRFIPSIRTTHAAQGFGLNAVLVFVDECHQRAATLRAGRAAWAGLILAQPFEAAETLPAAVRTRAVPNQPGVIIVGATRQIGGELAEASHVRCRRIELRHGRRAARACVDMPL